MALIEELSAGDQAALDAMRSESAQPASGEGTAPPAPAQPASVPAEPAPEPAADPAATPEPQQKMVPHSALHEERERRKELDARLKQAEERFNLVVERLGQPQPQQPAQPAPEAPKIPDLATDPAGHILETMRATGMNVEQLTQAVREQSERQRQQDMIGDLQRRSAVAEQEFRAETPDYDAAVNHLIGVRNKQLEITGMSDPAQRYAVIDREKLQLAAAAAQQGKNPAAIAYELAKSYGYAPTAPVAAIPAAQPEVNAGAEKLERIEAGQQQGRSLGAARGNAPSATPPAQRLLEMPQDKFAEMLDKATPEQMREMFGG